MAVIYIPGASNTTWNPSDKSAGITLANGNLSESESAGSTQGVRGTSSFSSGKRMISYQVNTLTTTGDMYLGFGTGSAVLNTGGFKANTWQYRDNGFAADETTALGPYTTYTAGSIVSAAVDFATGNIWFAVNGTWVNSGDPGAGTGATVTTTAGTTLFPLRLSENQAGTSGSYILPHGGDGVTLPSGFSYWDTTSQLTITGSAPTVNVTVTGVSISVGAGAAAISGQVPSLQYAISLQPSAGAATAVGQTPVAMIPVRMTPSAGGLGYTGQAPTLRFAYKISPSSAGVTINGQLPLRRVGTPINVGASNATLTGISAGNGVGYAVGAGATTIGGQAVNLSQSIFVGVPGGGLTFAGQAPSIPVNAEVRYNVVRATSRFRNKKSVTLKF